MFLYLRGLEIGTNLFKASVNLSAKHAQFHILGTSVESKSAAQSKELNQSHIPKKSARLKL